MVFHKLRYLTLYFSYLNCIIQNTILLFKKGSPVIKLQSLTLTMSENSFSDAFIGSRNQHMDVFRSYSDIILWKYKRFLDHSLRLYYKNMMFFTEIADPSYWKLTDSVLTVEDPALDWTKPSECEWQLCGLSLVHKLPFWSSFPMEEHLAQLWYKGKGLALPQIGIPDIVGSQRKALPPLKSG